MRGPWQVGAKTVRVGSLEAEIWYPAAPGSEATRERARYDIRKSLPDTEAAKIPDGDNPWQQCDCYRDLPLDETRGPYPVVVFVHGTAAFRHQSLPIVTHWASRGFVVIAADHPGLYLKHFIGMACGQQPPKQNLAGDVDALIAALGSPANDLAFLTGRIDATRIAVAGHSAGGGAAAASSTKPGVRVVISMAGAQATAASSSLESVLYLGGLADSIAAWNRVTMAWSGSPAPRRLVGIENAGHLAFSDLCQAKNAQGKDLLQIANDKSVCGANLAGFLFDCDPAQLEGQRGWDIINYATTSVLESSLQCRTVATDIRAAYPEVKDYREE